MHVHLEYFENPNALTLFIANGVTTVRNMDGLDYILGWKRAVNAGTLIGPTTLAHAAVRTGDRYGPSQTQWRSISPCSCSRSTTAREGAAALLLQCREGMARGIRCCTPLHHCSGDGHLNWGEFRGARTAQESL